MSFSDQAPAPARSFGERLYGTLKLDPEAFTEIEHDPSSLGQAAIVVTVAAAAAGLGNTLAETGEAVALAIIGNLFAWAISTAIIWLIGVVWLKYESDYPELLRTIGFATAPRPSTCWRTATLEWSPWQWDGPGAWPHT